MKNNIREKIKEHLPFVYGILLCASLLYVAIIVIYLLGLSDIK